MSHILVGALPFSNHVFEHLTLARALKDQGHRVSFYADAWARPHALEQGCEFVEASSGNLLEAFRQSKTTAAVTRLFQNHSELSSAHLWSWLSKNQVDGCLLDSTSLGFALAAERSGRPWASLAITPAERARLFREESAQAKLKPSGIRRRLGLPTSSRSASDQALSPFLTLQPWMKQFDMGRSPSNAVHIGNLVLPAATVARPRWIAGLDPRRSTVLVTMTSMPFDALTEWMEYFGSVAVAVLNELDVQAIISTGAFSSRFPQGRSRSVRYVQNVSHAHIMPHLDAIVTHGGWGTIGRALRYGVPQVNVPMIMDQPLNSRRAAKLGVGLSIPIEKLTGERLYQALQALLALRSGYRSAARKFSREMTQYGGAEAGARLVAQLVAR